MRRERIKTAVSKKETSKRKKRPVSAFDEAVKVVRRRQKRDAAKMLKMKLASRQELIKALDSSAKGKLSPSPFKAGPIISFKETASSSEQQIKTLFLTLLPVLLVSIILFMFYNHGVL